MVSLFSNTVNKLLQFELFNRFFFYFQRFSIHTEEFGSNRGPPINLRLQFIDFTDPFIGIPKLSNNWFTVTKQMQSLVFHDIKAWIEKDAFNTNHFENLQDLIFQSSDINPFAGAFNGLSNLKTLSFIHTKIVKFLPLILAPLRSLVTFTMKKCFKEEISLDNLFGTNNLVTVKKVEISGCNLSTTITEHTFIGLWNITDLVLADNQISQIGPRSFDTIFRTLEQLNLMINDLRSLPKFIFTKAIPTRVKINLQQNPWHCDCGLEDFRTFLRHMQRNIKSQQIICATPEEHAGNELFLLPPLCSDISLKLPVASASLVDQYNKHTNEIQIHHEVDLPGTETEEKAQTEIPSSLFNLTVFVRLPKPAANGSVTHAFFAIQLLYSLFFHFPMFLSEI